VALRDVFIAAIRDRRILRVQYPPGERLIEPYALGLTSVGNLVVRVWQREGASKTCDDEGLKLMRLDRFLMVEPTHIHFLTPRPQYDPNDAAMKGGIIAALKRAA
jgi:hypothetical protein